MITIHDVLKRLRGEYLEMPGLRLTAKQVQRLCGIEEMVCQSVLKALVDSKFLCVRTDGSYARVRDGEMLSLRNAAKADLGSPEPIRKAS